MEWDRLEDLCIGRVKALKILDLWMNSVFTTHTTQTVCALVIERWSGDSCAGVVDVLLSNYYTVNEKVGGEDVIVETDESKFGKRKYNKGHRVEGV